MNEQLIILDGAMGTMLQAAGMTPGTHPEVFGLEHPEQITAIHKNYIDAGSRLIYANTFGANRYKLQGTDLSPSDAIKSAVSAAKQAANGIASVALDVSPIGELLEPLGTLAFEDAYDMYREMVIAGESAGADLVVFETFTDLYDVKAAVLAAKENTKLPVWVTMSFEKSGRTFTGTTIPAFASTASALGVDALGINCSLGPNEIYPLAEELTHWTDLPLIIKPNAGLPDPSTNQFELCPDDFAVQMKPFLDLGVSAIGGCCGTTPDFIRAIAPFANEPRAARHTPDKRGVCSPTCMVEFNGVNIIGERLNPTGKKRFQQALKDHDLDYILKVALEQEEAGADILDVNVGLPGADEVTLMRDVVKALQSVISLPLQIDSTNPEVIEAGLRVCNGRAIINSVNGTPETLDAILPIAKKYGAAVIGLTMDENGLPQTAEQRFEIAERILNAALAHGIPKEDVIIDCLTLTVSAQQEQARETLKAVEMVHRKLGLHCTLGVSNISFGLPERTHVTESFLTQAMYCGLDFPIINPNLTRIMEAIISYRTLSGEDAACDAYINYFSQSANAASDTKAPSTDAAMTIEHAIMKGLKAETTALAEQHLTSMSELELINEKLIPALDVVGEQYEKQIIFLPQLINAANAACCAFDLINARIAASGAAPVSRGTIVLATVKGDIHDIGKNIVKVILENYGYHIIDLGRDVAVEKIVDTVIAQDVKLVGLSALMTTTVPAMADTIQALKASNHDCQVWVGGAVLTPEYADEIGADFYAKDARDSVDIAKKVFGE